MKEPSFKYFQFKSVSLVIFSLCFLSSLPVSSETTQPNSGPRNTFAPNNSVAKLKAQIMCAFEQNGLPAGPTNQRARANYSANHLSQVMAQIQPPLSSVMIHNMLAQVVAETGNLRNLVEQRSSYASSQSRFRGRGLIQMTHRENYARFAGCAEAIRNSPPPAQITRETLARAPALTNSPLVQNPESAMSESTLEGQQLNAWSLICYMIPTAERHTRFENALNCANPPCVREVGVGVNHGPGALGRGRTPLGDRHRLDAFRKMSQCFSNSQMAGL